MERVLSRLIKTRASTIELSMMPIKARGESPKGFFGKVVAPVSLRKAVEVLGAGWGSGRTHELGEGFINLSTKLLTLQGENGREYLHPVLDGLGVEKGTTRILGMNIHPMFAEVLVGEGAGFFLKSDLTRVLSQIKAKVGTRPWVTCYQIDMSIRRLAPSKRWHASEETVYMWGKPSDAPAWADLDRRARFKERAWLARIPEIFNSSFSNYRYKIVRVKQKDGKWGFVCRVRREGVRLSTKTYIRETLAELVQGKASRVEAQGSAEEVSEKAEELTKKRELRIKARRDKSG